MTGQAGRGGNMEDNMTDKQFKTIIGNVRHDTRRLQGPRGGQKESGETAGRAKK